MSSKKSIIRYKEFNKIDNFELMLTKSIDNILDNFDKIGLHEMEDVKLMDRVDTKFIFSSEKFAALLPELDQHYKALSIGGKTISAYESLYYDSEDLLFFNEHQRKKLNRMKVRYRKYLDSDIAFLEVKHKFKGRTNKMRIPSDELHMDMPKDHLDFVNESVSFDDFDGLVATLTNNYRRITLVGKHINERLTIDLDLKFNWNGKKSNMDFLVIAELKQSKVNRTSPFFQLMKNHKIRPFRLSKYCIGIIKLDPSVKHNRFKKKLLQIKKIKPNAA